MKKLDFDDWILEHYEEDEDRPGIYFNDPYVVDEYNNVKEHTIDKVVNHYLEYYAKEGKITWGVDRILQEEDINEEELTEVVFAIDEIVLSELATGEAPQCMIIGNLLYHNICEFYNSTNIPTNPEGDFDGSLLNMHPAIYEVLREWLEFYSPFMIWDLNTGAEDFWECFVYSQ